MGRLLETSVLIHVERGRAELAEISTRFADESFAISAITAAEMLEGVHGAATDEQRIKREAFVEGILARIPIVPFDIRVARVYARLKRGLDRKGSPVGAHDLMIAATALAIGYGVITTDKRSFPRVPGIEVTLVAVSPTKAKGR